MQSLEVSGAVRPLLGSLGVKGLKCTLPQLYLNTRPNFIPTEQNYLKVQAKLSLCSVKHHAVQYKWNGGMAPCILCVYTKRRITAAEMKYVRKTSRRHLDRP